VTTTPLKAPGLPKLLARKGGNQPIAMLTAYDASSARIADRAGVDCLLVGDSLGMVIQGYGDTCPVTLDQMVYHTAIVRRCSNLPIVADMPFLVGQGSADAALAAAGRLIAEGGADAVKIEGAGPMIDTVAYLAQRGLAVVGHLGLSPQSARRDGWGKKAKSEDEGAQLVADAVALSEAGAVMIVLENIPAELAAQATAAIAIPTIGIGAGRQCDGQVLVFHDVVGLTETPPPFATPKLGGFALLTEAVAAWVNEVHQAS